MATAAVTQKKPCSKCDKGGGIFTCDGCQQSFCRKHSDEHRQELAIQMDSLGQELDVFQRDINRDADVHPLLSGIDMWERESINKIQQVAEQARADLDQLMNKKKQELKTTMGKLTNELQSSRESEDYTELDLKKWINQLNELRQELEQSTNTYLVDEADRRSVIRFIKVRNSQQLRSSAQAFPASGQNSHINHNSIPANRERFNKGDEEITLSDNNHVAMYSGPKLPRSTIIFGNNQYSMGTHRIRFRIEKQTDTNFYFGIVTFSQMDSTSVFSAETTVNGWWRCDYAVVYGKVIDPPSNRAILEEGDEVTLTLNCDQRQIYLNNQRTKRILRLSVDIQKCSFPWKFVVGLGSIGNCVRIIQ